MMGTTRIVVGALLVAGFASLVQMAPISAVAQSSSTLPTEQQGRPADRGSNHTNIRITIPTKV